jgi:hypothetical protein
MRKADIQIGKFYIAKVSGKLVPVKITDPSPHGGWMALNLSTKRDIRIKSAARLRQEYAPAPPRRPDLGSVTPPTDLTTPRKAPAERGITLAYIRHWRQREHDAGRPSTMAAFWLAHGLCPICHGRGVVLTSWPATGERDCQECGGTGLLSTEATV